MKKLFFGAAALWLVWQIATHTGRVPSSHVEVGNPPSAISQAQGSSLALEQAFHQHARGAQVEGGGIVEKVLSDDTNGSRHQRFIVRLQSGQTILIAHNIDLAPRIESLRSGTPIWFSGEYEWNEKGGIVHWTHHDPRGTHRAGCIEYEGRRYQ